MRRTLFAMFGILLTVSVMSQSKLNRRIDFLVENVPIANALLSLCEKADLSISFKSSLFSDEQTLSLQEKNKTIKFLLNACLKQTDIGYKFEDKRIVLYQKPPPVFTISGFIEDTLSGERLVGATVYDALSGRGTASNEYGFYSIAIPRGKAKLRYSYLGFKAKEYQVNVGKNLSFNVPLNASITLKEIVIIDNRINTQIGLSVEQTPNYSSKLLQQIPALAGEPDVLNYFKTLAGVQTAEGGLGGICVRGGNADQNLVLLDGVSVYNPSHALGLLSIFNPNMMKSSQLYKGKFPAKYGGRLSSVIDVQTRDGNNKKFSAELGISLIATNLLLEGPIKKEKTAYLVSVRRTHLDPLIKAASKLEKETEGVEGNFNYHFYDINVKLNHTFSDKDRLYLSFYSGADAYEDESTYTDSFEEEDDSFFEEQSNYLRYRWGNNIFSLRYNHLWNAQLFSNTTFTYSQFKFETYLGEEFYSEESDSSFSVSQVLNFKSDIQELGLKTDFDYSLNNQHSIKFGASFYQRYFTPEVLEETYLTEGNYDFGNGEIEGFISGSTLIASEVNIYAQDNIKLSDKWQLEVGLHTALFNAPDKVYWSVQPRLFIQNQVTSSGSFYASIAKMTQFLHVLQSYGSGIPNDLWVPATKNIAPQQSWQLSMGTNWKLPASFSWSMEGYFKKLNKLITYRDGIIFSASDEDNYFPWEEELTVGEGWNYGIETSLKRTVGKATGWINYTYSEANRRFDTFNNGEKFPFRFNRTHQVKIGYKQQFGPKFSIFTTWTYGSGQHITLIQNVNEEDLAIIEDDILKFIITDSSGPVNGYQLSNIRRLDINFNFHWTKKRSEQSFSVGLINANNHANPVYAYQLHPSLVQMGEISIVETGGIGLFPSLRYSLKF